MVKAVSALTAAFRLVQLDSCGQSVEESCLREVQILMSRMLEMVMSLAKLFTVNKLVGLKGGKIEVSQPYG